MDAVVDLRNLPSELLDWSLSVRSVKHHKSEEEQDNRNEEPLTIGCKADRSGKCTYRTLYLS